MMDHVARRRRYYMMFARAHGWFLLRTKGRPGYMTPRLRCFVLVTTGRRSKQRRRVPLLYMPDEGGFIVMASNFGQEHPPAWWLNLQATPDAAVQLQGREIAVRARELEGNERTSVLARAIAYNKQWRGYATKLHRTLPVVRLEPVSR